MACSYVYLSSAANMVVHSSYDKHRITVVDFATPMTTDGIPLLDRNNLYNSNQQRKVQRRVFVKCFPWRWSYTSEAGEKIIPGFRHPLTYERISVFFSAVCLAATLLWYIANSGNLVLVRVSRETLLFSRNKTVTESMQLMHSTWNTHCTQDFKLLLQIPSWPGAPNEEGLVMHSSIYSSDISILWLAVFVYTFSILFQSWRCRNYDSNYKPGRGPEFSRWLEYFFTSPLQIIIVSSSFGFATLDSLLGQCGMQAALVLLGYDIELQIKKIYKRKSLENPGRKTEGFVHVLSGVGVADLRILVYLGFSWLLHFGIWGIPFVPGHGIGGKYFQLRQQLANCLVDSDNMQIPKAAIPDAVTAIYVLQYVLFTIFGLVCSWQVLRALLLKQGAEIDTEKKWIVVSTRYSILSVTAKTLLEAGLAAYVVMYKEWKLVPNANIYQHDINNHKCLAIAS